MQWASSSSAFDLQSQSIIFAFWQNQIPSPALAVFVQTNLNLLILSGIELVRALDFTQTHFDQKQLAPNLFDIALEFDVYTPTAEVVLPHHGQVQSSSCWLENLCCKHIQQS